MQDRPARHAGSPADEGPGELRGMVTPEAWVRDHIQAERNHFPELEDLADIESRRRLG